jgi:Carbohydrate binding module (family 35)/K319L-like, PKD domain
MIFGSKRILFLIISCIVFLSQSLPAYLDFYEAEDGVLEGPNAVVSISHTGFSGTGYVADFYDTGDKVTVTVNIHAAGDYPLVIGYHISLGWGNKVNDILVNDNLVGSPSFLNTNSEWLVHYFGDVTLNAGSNTITFEKSWGWMDVDYFAIDNLLPAASDPVPEDHLQVDTSLTEICWTSPEPETSGDTITSDVYFGTTVPNLSLTGYGLSQIASRTAATCLPVSVSLNEIYYWVVNSYDPHGGSPEGSGEVLTEGELWDFNTLNGPPEVDAGMYQVFWLTDKSVISLDGTVTDDGFPYGILTYSWKQMTGPLVLIDPNDVEETSVTLTEPGNYKFALTANDADAEITDVVEFVVFNNPCEAAQSQSGFKLPNGDINKDCFEDISDLAKFAADWLECVDPSGCE